MIHLISVMHVHSVMQFLWPEVMHGIVKKSVILGFVAVLLLGAQSWTWHYSDVIMGVTASLITSLTRVYSTIHASSDRRKHQSSASLAFVRGIHRWLVNSPHKWPVMRKIFPFDDVIMIRTTVMDMTWISCPSLQWCYMITMTSQIPRNLTVCSTVCLGWYQANHKRPHYWPFVKGFHQWPVNSPHKAPVAFPCHHHDLSIIITLMSHKHHASQMTRNSFFNSLFRIKT